MSAADSIIALYERHAHAWDDTRNQRLIERHWLDRFVAVLAEGAHVLDIGCGAGAPIARYLIARGCYVTGIDTAPSFVALCRRRFPAHSWAVADMRTLALGNRFDGLIAWHSLFHLTPGDQRQMFAVLAAHAAPRAVLMFTTGPSFGEHIGEWQGEPLYHASLDPAEYRSLLAVNGFSVLGHTIEDPACGGATVWLAQKSAVDEL